MKCIACAALDLHTFPAHAGTGYGRCRHEQAPGVFESIDHERQCPMFAAADAKVAEERKTVFMRLG